jgi:hypothetical protein
MFTMDINKEIDNPKGPGDAGAKELQKLDKLSFKLTFAKKDFDESTVRVATERLVVKSKRALTQACPLALGFFHANPRH